MADFKLSEYQEEILNYFIKNPHGNMLINAKAGSGKSSTLRILTEHTKTSDIYLAFNNSIAKEFKEKIMNPKTKVYTIHALAFLIMNNNLSGAVTDKKGFGVSRTKDTKKTSEATLDNLKPYKILDSIFYKDYGKINFDYKQFLSTGFVQLYNLARVMMIDLESNDDIIKIVREHNLFEKSEEGFNSPPSNKICNILRRLDYKSKKQFEIDKIIDFTDMLYITYWKLKDKEWKVPYWLLFTNIYLDECLPGYTHVPCKYQESMNLPCVCRTFTLENLWKMQERGEELPLALSFDVNTNQFEYKQIKNVKKQRIAKTWGIRTTSLNSRGYEDIRSTDKHLFLTYDNNQNEFYWEYMKDLKVGDKVVKGYSDEETDCMVSEIIKTFPGKVERVYDIEVEDNHNFIAKSDPHDDGFVVHNCQDQNNLQLNLIKFIKREGGRYVAVGDFFQSCYLFNGSNAHSFNLIPKLFSPMKEFELPICYRCPTSHLEKVNKEFGIPIFPRPDAPKGNIKTIDKRDIIKYVSPGDMIIARKNKWLADIIPMLITKDFPIYFEDREFVNSIKKILKTKERDSLTSFLDYLEYSVERWDRIQNNENEEKEKDSIQIDNFIFILGILKPYISKHPKATYANFKTYLEKLLCVTSSSNAIRVTSVHKAKGLEADNVFVLNEGKVCYNSYCSKEQNIQERNLSYISITRAKKNLYLVREP